MQSFFTYKTNINIISEFIGESVAQGTTNEVVKSIRQVEPAAVGGEGGRDTKSRSVVKDLRLLRTPNDIFSFYDISRDGATTV